MQSVTQLLQSVQDLVVAWGSRMRLSEKDSKLAQKFGQLEPFIAAAVYQQECMGQLASFGPS